MNNSQKCNIIYSMDITETEDIKKRWQEYTEELYKKFLMTEIMMMVWSLT